MSVDIWLGADELTNDMVTDFKHLNWFKQFIDDYIDHKFIIDINDPLFYTITHHMPLDVKRYSNGLGYFELSHKQGNELLNEFTESFVVVDFVPTSENLSKYFFEFAQKKMEKIGVKVIKVAFRETPKSEACYGV